MPIFFLDYHCTSFVPLELTPTILAPILRLSTVLNLPSAYSSTRVFLKYLVPFLFALPDGRSTSYLYHIPSHKYLVILYTSQLIACLILLELPSTSAFSSFYLLILYTSLLTMLSLLTFLRQIPSLLPRIPSHPPRRLSSTSSLLLNHQPLAVLPPLLA